MRDHSRLVDVHPQLVVVGRDVSAADVARQRCLLHAEERRAQRRDSLLLENLAGLEAGPRGDDLEAEALDVEAGVDLLRHGDDAFECVITLLLGPRERATYAQRWPRSCWCHSRTWG